MASDTQTRQGHTPGPWKLFMGTGRMRIAVYGANEKSVCSVSSGSYKTPTQEAEANAHLIAAAPELLAALKALLADIDSGLLVRDITRDGEPGWSMHMLAFVQRLQAAQAAIQLAEGADPAPGGRE